MLNKPLIRVTGLIEIFSGIGVPPFRPLPVSARWQFIGERRIKRGGAIRET